MENMQREEILAARRQARKDFELKGLELLELHKRALLLVRQGHGEFILCRAHEMIDIWERSNLCSRYYIDKWRAMLASPEEGISFAISSAPEAPALRQNTPFGFLMSTFAQPKP